MSKISKNQDFPKFLKMGFPKCVFFRKWTCLRVWTERPKICYHVYLYVIWHFWMNFFVIFRIFWNLTFLEIWIIFEKPDLWLTFLEKGRSKIQKNEVKVVIYGRKYSFYLNIQNFYLILGPPPRGFVCKFTFSKIIKNLQKSWFYKILKNDISKMWFFWKMNELVCVYE